MTPPLAPLTARERVLLAVSLVAAVLYGLGDRLGIVGSSALVVKGATVALLALLAFGRRSELPGGPLLALALGAHAAGDVMLDRAFLAGVGAFFVGHLLYIALFWRERRAVDDFGGETKLALGLVALVAAGFVVVLTPRLAPPERIAIPLYAGALACMAGSALVCRRGRPWVPAGALLYVVSDALLSFELFGLGGGGVRRLVWPLYVAAQLAIALGWCLGSSEERAEEGESAAVEAPPPGDDLAPG